MDSKTKHRILGLFVLVAIVVLLLPFFQHGKDRAPNTDALVKAPPFPAQTQTLPQDNPEQAHILQPREDHALQQPDDTIEKLPDSKIVAPVTDMTTPQPEKKEEKPATNLNREVSMAPISLPNKLATRTPPKAQANRAFAVQMGSFRDKANALQLANKLREEHYAAFVQEKNNHIRVYVGPMARQADAHQLMQRIEKATNLRGIVVPYNPFQM